MKQYIKRIISMILTAGILMTNVDYSIWASVPQETKDVITDETTEEIISTVEESEQDQENTSEEVVPQDEDEVSSEAIADEIDDNSEEVSEETVKETEENESDESSEQTLDEVKVVLEKRNKNSINSKTYITPTPNMISITDVENDQKQFKITLPDTGYLDIKVAVWSETDGQDDLIWHQAEKSGNSYVATVEVKEHATTGRYYVHAYGRDSTGTQCFLAGSTFYVQPVEIEKMEAEDTENGFDIKLSGTTSPAGIEKIEIGVWNKPDKSDAIWKTLSPSEDDNYVLHVDIADFQMYMGQYYIDVYATDGNGIRNFCGSITKLISITAKSIKSSMEQDGCEIIISDVKDYGYGESLSIAIWSKNNGQDDLIWYTAQKDGDDYSVFISNEKLTDTGLYYAHAYLMNETYGDKMIAGTTFSVDCKMKMGEIENGEIPIEVYAINPETGFVEIIAQVWTKEDKSDLLEIHVMDVSSGKCMISVPLASFNLYTGDYYINVYGKFSNGETKLLQEYTKNVVFNKGTAEEVVLSEDETQYIITLSDVNLQGLEDKIRFAVWSAADGQDDLIWYEAEKDEDTYKVTVDAAEFTGIGKYNIHMYADLKSGTTIYLAGTTFQLKISDYAKLEITDINGKKGTAVVNETLGYEVSKIQVGVWNTTHNGDVVWYHMKESDESQYTATIDIKNHDYQFGNYSAHVYITDAEGNTQYVNGTSFKVTADNYIVYQGTETGKGKVSIYGPNVNGVSITNIEMATWTSEGAQDDLKWIDAKQAEDGSYYVEIDSSDYNRDGSFLTHVYGYLDGKSYCLAGIGYTLYRIREFDDAAKVVMHNIIYAVETGGQIYGNAQYDCFCPAYNLTARETAITIGAGGWFATEAQKLLKLIREEDPELFESLDAEGISEDLDNEDWQYYGSDGNGNATILRESDKAKCIQALISSEAGIAVQNRLVDEEMTEYVKEAEELGVTDLKARMFCANVRHLGGYGAMSRIINWCIADGLPLTMENIYNSMRDNTSDKSGNTVGADKYVTRHTKVMGWINKYIV